MSDILLKVLSGNIRAKIALTKDLCQEAKNRHHLQSWSSIALGRLLTGALLLAENKTNEGITIKISGDGPFQKMIVDANGNGQVRGFIQHPTEQINSVAEGIGKGLLSVTRWSELKQNVVGECELVSGEIAEDLTHYLWQSEQIPSSVALGVQITSDGIIQGAGGFFIQVLPDATDEEIALVEKNLKSLHHISKLFAEGMTCEDLAKKIFENSSQPIQFLETIPLKFACQCSRVRTEDKLVSLPVKDIQSLVDDGQAEVCCSFCGAKYLFDREDLLVILHVAEKLQAMKK